MASQNTFQEIINALVEVAKNDGIITANEEEIIKQVKVDADSFALILEDAKQDGIITDIERSSLLEFKDLIIERAQTIASLDGIVQDEEKEMLAKLSEILTSYSNKT